MILYHGTTSNNLESINQQGLINPCLTQSIQLAEQYAGLATDKLNGSPVVLRVKLRDFSMLRADCDAIENPLFHDGHTTDHYKFLVESYLDKHDDIQDLQWGVSLRLVNCCRYEGLLENNITTPITVVEVASGYNCETAIL